MTITLVFNTFSATDLSDLEYSTILKYSVNISNIVLYLNSSIFSSW